MLSLKVSQIIGLLTLNAISIAKCLQQPSKDQQP